MNFHSAHVTAPLMLNGCGINSRLPVDKAAVALGMAPMVGVPIPIFLLWAGDDGSF